MRVITILTRINAGFNFIRHIMEFRRFCGKQTRVKCQRGRVLNTPGAFQVIAECQANGIAFMMRKIKQIPGGIVIQPCRSSY